MLILDYIKSTWNFIDGLNEHLKTIVITILLIGFGCFYISIQMDKNLKDYTEQLEFLDRKYDKYTMEISPQINQYIYNIQQEDKGCYNVLLLSYHNSKKSLQGFRYLYLNCITEKPKGLNEEVKDYWNELEYVYYEDELSKINNQGFLNVENINSMKYSFPKLYRRLLASGAQSTTIYSIQGVDSPIGLVVVLYKNNHVWNYKDYSTNVAPYIQKLSIMLDYPNIKKKNL